jgi:hypothetical protein
MKDESQPKDPAAGSAGQPKPGANSPEAKAKTDWQMPAPVFRVSAGKTVKRHAPDDPGAESAGPAGEAPADLDALPDAPPDPGSAVKPVADEPAGVEAEAAPAKEKPGSLVLKIVFTVLGVFGIVLVLIIVLSLVYLFFFYGGRPGGSSD